MQDAPEDQDVDDFDDIDDDEQWVRQETMPFYDPRELIKAHKKTSKNQTLSLSEFVEVAFRYPRSDGQIGWENFSFDNRKHLRRPYDTGSRRILLCTARQVEKSTYLGNRALSMCCMIPGYRILYVSPTSTQTKTFSNDRINEPIQTSEVIKAFTSSMITMNVFEKQFSNFSKITLRNAYLNADRCVAGSTRVHFADGSVATIEQIYANQDKYVGKYVWSSDARGTSIVAAKLTEAVDQGVRGVYRVRMQGGAEVVCTHNQPFLTGRGWKELVDLRPGDLVAVPGRPPHGAGNGIPVDEYKLIGYLLGDGTVVSYSAVGFFSGSPTVMRDFIESAKRMGAKLARVRDSNRAKWVHSKTKVQFILGKRGTGSYKDRLVSYGLIGKRHYDKAIPDALFSGDRNQVAAFLGAIYATDGWASITNTPSGVQYEIGYCSNSKQLVADLKILLARFGVRATISRRKKPSTKNALGAYTLSVRDSVSIKRFCADIKIVGKSREQAAVLRAASAVCKNKDDADQVPVSYMELRAYLQDKHGLSTHTAWTRHKIQLHGDTSAGSIGRRVLWKVALKLGDGHLAALAASAVGWARIEDIAHEGCQHTYDLSVDQTENYLVDGVFVHNTRGIPAWGLEIDEFQDILSDNLPIIEQCLSHAPDPMKFYLYAGTPKSLDNNIEYYRSGFSKNNNRPMSTMSEWAVPCDSCGSADGAGRYWNILGEKNIGKDGLICERCGKIIDPMHPQAQWAAMQKDGIFEHFRIPQLMVPWKKWDEILIDYGTYPRDKFYNEVLGLSYDSGTRPLNMGEVRACCNPDVPNDDLDSYKGQDIPVFAGIDWGCHDDKTRILTRTGLKYFRDLTMEDEVAQFNPQTRVMSWTKPLHITDKEWSGDMIKIRSLGVDMLVTTDHKMWAFHENKWRVYAAGELVGKNDLAFAGYAVLEGEEHPTYRPLPDREVPTDALMELVGRILRHGKIAKHGGYNAVLLPYKDCNDIKYDKLLAALGLHAKPFSAEGTHTRRIVGKWFTGWFIQSFGSLLREREIPPWVMEFSYRQRKILLAAILGKDPGLLRASDFKTTIYAKMAPKLAEGIMLLASSLGLWAHAVPNVPVSGRGATADLSIQRRKDANVDSHHITKQFYRGRVYCVTVPDGFIVTERNGKMAYQGNSGENSFTVLTLGRYNGSKFQIFYIHRFTGQELDPKYQLELITQLVKDINPLIIGADYGGGFHQNDEMVRLVGPQRLAKFQHLGKLKRKVEYDGKLRRYKLYRTEVMSDVFNAIKARKIAFPRWEDMASPYAEDICNIYAEYNERMHMIQYGHHPDRPDDSFHSIMYCLLASMIKFPRPDIIAPLREVDGNPTKHIYRPVDQGSDYGPGTGGMLGM